MTQLEATEVWWFSKADTTGIIRRCQRERKQGTYSICGPPHHCHLNSHHLHHKSNWLVCSASSCTETHHFCTAGAPLDLQSLQEKKNWIVQKELQEKYSQSQRSLSLILQIKQQIAFWIYTIILKLLFQSSINFDSVHVFIWVIDGFYGKQEVQQNKAKQYNTIQNNTIQYNTIQYKNKN